MLMADIQLMAEFDICPCFLTGLFYDDRSRLSEEDCEALDDFLNDLHLFGIKSPLYDAIGIETYWERCDITMLHSDCVKLKVYQDKKEL